MFNPLKHTLKKISGFDEEKFHDDEDVQEYSKRKSRISATQVTEGALKVKRGSCWISSTVPTTKSLH